MLRLKLPWQLQSELLRAINRSGLSFEEALGALQKATKEKKERERDFERDAETNEHQLNMLDDNGTDI